MGIKIKAFAKINFTLDVVGQRDDGYHLIQSVMQQISLCDNLFLEPANGIHIRCDHRYLSLSPRNTIYTAAQLFFEAAGWPDAGVSFSLKKSIPFSSGLGGGSADAAAALIGLNRLFHTGFSTARLCELGAKIGADVPFCVVGGAALAEGTGERITPCSPLREGFLVLVKSGRKKSTRHMYALLDESGYTPGTASTQALAALEHGDLPALGALEHGDLPALGASLHNVFEPLWQDSEIPAIRAKMLAFGAVGASLSGSGPTYFGLFEHEEQARQCTTALKGEYPEVYLCRPVG